jgi:hypothetical protein
MKRQSPASTSACVHSASANSYETTSNHRSLSDMEVRLRYADGKKPMSRRHRMDQSSLATGLRYSVPGYMQISLSLSLFLSLSLSVCVCVCVCVCLLGTARDRPFRRRSANRRSRSGNSCVGRRSETLRVLFGPIDHIVHQSDSAHPSAQSTADDSNPTTSVPEWVLL